MTWHFLHTWLCSFCFTSTVLLSNRSRSSPDLSNWLFARQCYLHQCILLPRYPSFFFFSGLTLHLVKSKFLDQGSNPRSPKHWMSQGIPDNHHFKVIFGEGALRQRYNLQKGHSRWSVWPRRFRRPFRTQGQSSFAPNFFISISFFITDWTEHHRT